MSEARLHQHIYQHAAGLTRMFPHVLVGPGDDCAVVAGGDAAGGAVLLTVDQVIEDRHFFGRKAASPTPLELVARKAVARSVSDIAAMGGEPRWALATAALPKGFAEGDRLFDAMHRWARAMSVPLVGGDVATHGEAGAPMVLTVTVGGVADRTRGPVLRSGARAGDEVWVTGEVGGSLKSGKHLEFTPRIAEGRALVLRLGEDVHAMIDISDGVGRDAGRIADASGVRIEIEAARLPLSAAGMDPIIAAGEGEDYELLFTARPGVVETMLGSWAPQLAPLTRIGTVRAGRGCVLIDAGGGERDARGLGWDH